MSCAKNNGTCLYEILQLRPSNLGMVKAYVLRSQLKYCILYVGPIYFFLYC